MVGQSHLVPHGLGGKSQRGRSLAGTAAPGDVFTDARGQRYVRDQHGTIRRVR